MEPDFRQHGGGGVSAPEIAVGWAVDDEGDAVVRLAFIVNDSEVSVADMLPQGARDMAALLIGMADKVEANARTAAAQVAGVTAK